MKETNHMHTKLRRKAESKKGLTDWREGGRKEGGRESNRRKEECIK